MARRELGPASLRVAQAVAAVLPGPAVVGCSGGADSLALALGAQWAAERMGTAVGAMIVDHGLQPGSAGVAARVAEVLGERGMAAEVVRVHVQTSDGGLEAAARAARLSALTEPGLPVLLGHTLDDQAETVLLGLLRGSGTRSLAGMSASLDTPSFVPHDGTRDPGVDDGTRGSKPGPECGAGSPEDAQAAGSRAVYRGPLLRPLLHLRRADTEQACREWGATPWDDPMNDDARFARVAIRQHLAGLSEAVGRDLAPALARTAQLARADADLLDDLAARAARIDGDLTVDDLVPLPDALRWRVLHRWLGRAVESVEFQHVLAVDALVTDWRGQGPLSLPGCRVQRTAGALYLLR